MAAPLHLHYFRCFLYRYLPRLTSSRGVRRRGQSQSGTTCVSRRLAPYTERRAFPLLGWIDVSALFPGHVAAPALSLLRVLPPPTGSQSGSATPGLTQVLTEYSLPGGGYSIVASEVNLSQRTGCSLPLNLDPQSR